MSKPKLPLPTDRKPVIFDVRKIGYIMMTLADFDDLVSGKVSIGKIDLVEKVEKDEKLDKRRKQIYAKPKKRKTKKP